MGRKSKAKFKLNGHTLPGINQKSETINLKDGRSPSSAFQMESPMKELTELKGIGDTFDPSAHLSDVEIPKFRDFISAKQQRRLNKKFLDKLKEKRERKKKEKEREEFKKSGAKTVSDYTAETGLADPDERTIITDEPVTETVDGGVELDIDLKGGNAWDYEFSPVVEETTTPVEEETTTPVEEEKAKNECPEGYHMVNGVCVLTAEGKAYQERMKREKENQETTSDEEKEGKTSKLGGVLSKVIEQGLQKTQDVSGPHEDDTGTYYLVEGKKKYYKYK